MMNLALNVQLTDEQYTQLMQTSYEKIFESQEFIQELSKTICSQIGQYLHDNPSEIKEALGISVPYYSSNKLQQENKLLMKRIIEDAAEGVSSDISDAVKDTIKEILAKVNMKDVIETVVTNAVLKGMGYGMHDHFEAVNRSIIGTNTELDALKSRLNNL